MKYAEVALPIPVDQNFTYLIPDHFMDSIQIGVRTLVPFGPRTLTGYIIDFSEVTALEEVRPLEDILDIEPVISTELLRVAKWIAEYYLCPLGEVIKAMLPTGMSIESQTYIHLNLDEKLIRSALTRIKANDQQMILHMLLKEKKVTMQHLRKNTYISSPSFAVSRLEKLGFIKRDIVVPLQAARPRMEKWLRPSKLFLQRKNQAKFIDELKIKAPSQAFGLRIITDRKEISKKELLKHIGANASSIRSLLKSKNIEQFEKETIRHYYIDANFNQAKPVILNQFQKEAVAELEVAISSGFFKSFLLYGVTGSGKTQVYIEAIKKTLSKGKTAIVLVPEISLTPQTVSRFTANFPNAVAVLHSRMSTGERFDSWRKLKDGTFKIAIGPRSAIFAPLQNIGLIVVDEEHESSYKQAETVPFYNARNVAVVRGKLNEAVVVLGSATPSIESFYNAKIMKYQLLRLPARVDNVPMPKVSIINMLQYKTVKKKGEPTIFSKPLLNKIEEKLSLKEQIILLQNRRGYSAFIKCHDCDYLENCINCNITLTYHKTTHRLRCHYCNYLKKAPNVCPKCGSMNIIFQGIGTQRVEAELQKAFPAARIIRMDMDTTAQKRSHDRILNKFGQHKYDILLGTQMVAKGHDFEKVTFVGVISSDTALFLPDFRASEITFQLLTQVAGRAGRKNLPGEVIIQTYSPDNYGITCSKTHDFIKFFTIELALRRELNYPPYSRIIQILVKGENEDEVKAVINKFRSNIPEHDKLYQILGPVPSPISKIQNYYRWHFILKVNKQLDPNGKTVNSLIRDIKNKMRNLIIKKEVKIHINVDPTSLI